MVKLKLSAFGILGLFILHVVSCKSNRVNSSLIYEDSRIIAYEVHSNDDIQFFLKDELGNNILDFDRLKVFLESRKKELKFAFNGGMYKKDRSPQGLYIEEGDIISPLDTMIHGYGNFYLQPNGVFSIDNHGHGSVIQTSDFSLSPEIAFATQSGPMLVIKGDIHPKFKNGSKHLNIRNGVGILPNGNVLLAISNTEINLYDFANYFKKNACLNALYLDGFVSKFYYPPSINQRGGKFGVMIGVIGESN